jgi:translocation and assembly module TamB
VKSTDQIGGNLTCAWTALPAGREYQPGAAQCQRQREAARPAAAGAGRSGFRQLSLAGSFDRKAERWKGTLSNTRFQTPVGPVALTRDIALDYRNLEQKISIGPHCWTNPNAELCVPQTIDAGASGRGGEPQPLRSGDAEAVYAGGDPGQRRV